MPNIYSDFNETINEMIYECSLNEESENHLWDKIDVLLENYGVPNEEELAEMDITVEEIFNPNNITAWKIQDYHNRVRQNKKILSLKF